MTSRGFPRPEIEARIARAQSMMDAEDLDVLLMTTEPDVRYFTGFLTRFWESPTRPWFLALPRLGSPIAVIPSIGEPLMKRAGVEDIRTWSSPDLKDDGITLLADTLDEICPRQGRIGVPDGHETYLRMPWSDFLRLQRCLPDNLFLGDSGIMRRLRMVKSDLEIEKIKTACDVGSRAFSRVPEIARVDVTLTDVFRNFQQLCLEEGADWVPYLAGGAGQGGYGDVISPASEAALTSGDVLMLDTGLVWDGYFCDFDRNWSFGPSAPNVISAYSRLIEAVDAGFEASKPGRRACEVYHAMSQVIGQETDAGRLGHGLGMSLTEWPSLIPTDETFLVPGMVLTLEPGTSTDGGILVHEENIVITETGAAFLSVRAPTEIPVL